MGRRRWTATSSAPRSSPSSVGPCRTAVRGAGLRNVPPVARQPHQSGDQVPGERVGGQQLAPLGQRPGAPGAHGLVQPARLDVQTSRTAIAARRTVAALSTTRAASSREQAAAACGWSPRRLTRTALACADGAVSALAGTCPPWATRQPSRPGRQCSGLSGQVGTPASSASQARSTTAGICSAAVPVARNRAATAAGLQHSDTDGPEPVPLGPRAPCGRRGHAGRRGRRATAAGRARRAGGLRDRSRRSSCLSPTARPCGAALMAHERNDRVRHESAPVRGRGRGGPAFTTGWRSSSSRGRRTPGPPWPGSRRSTRPAGRVARRRARPHGPCAGRRGWWWRTACSPRAPRSR